MDSPHSSYAMHDLEDLTRVQMQKLCRRFGLRATGKNGVLLLRLQEYIAAKEDTENSVSVSNRSKNCSRSTSDWSDILLSVSSDPTTPSRMQSPIATSSSKDITKTPRAIRMSTAVEDSSEGDFDVVLDLSSSMSSVVSPKVSSPLRSCVLSQSVTESSEMSVSERKTESSCDEAALSTLSFSGGSNVSEHQSSDDNLNEKQPPSPIDSEEMVEIPAIEYPPHELSLASVEDSNDNIDDNEVLEESDNQNLTEAETESELSYPSPSPKQLQTILPSTASVIIEPCSETHHWSPMPTNEEEIQRKEVLFQEKEDSLSDSSTNDEQATIGCISKALGIHYPMRAPHADSSESSVGECSSISSMHEKSSICDDSMNEGPATIGCISKILGIHLTSSSHSTLEENSSESASNEGLASPLRISHVPEDVFESSSGGNTDDMLTIDEFGSSLFDLPQKAPASLQHSENETLDGEMDMEIDSIPEPATIVENLHEKEENIRLGLIPACVRSPTLLTCPTAIIKASMTNKVPEESSCSSPTPNSEKNPAAHPLMDTCDDTSSDMESVMVVNPMKPSESLIQVKERPTRITQLSKRSIATRRRSSHIKRPVYVVKPQTQEESEETSDDDKDIVNGVLAFLSNSKPNEPSKLRERRATTNISKVTTQPISTMSRPGAKRISAAVHSNSHVFTQTKRSVVPRTSSAFKQQSSGLQSHFSRPTRVPGSTRSQAKPETVPKPKKKLAPRPSALGKRVAPRTSEAPPAKRAVTTSNSARPIQMPNFDALHKKEFKKQKPISEVPTSRVKRTLRQPVATLAGNENLANHNHPPKRTVRTTLTTEYKRKSIAAKRDAKREVVAPVTKKKFDLKASLARPLKYKPKKGPISRSSLKPTA